MAGDRALTAEETETRLWMRRYGWLDRDGNMYPISESGAQRCVLDCATDGHQSICVLGPHHDGECKCVECDR